MSKLQLVLPEGKSKTIVAKEIRLHRIEKRFVVKIFEYLSYHTDLKLSKFDKLDFIMSTVIRKAIYDHVINYQKGNYNIDNIINYFEDMYVERTHETAEVIHELTFTYSEYNNMFKYPVGY